MSTWESNSDVVTGGPVSAPRIDGVGEEAAGVVHASVPARRHDDGGVPAVPGGGVGGGLAARRGFEWQGLQLRHPVVETGALAAHSRKADGYSLKFAIDIHNSPRRSVHHKHAESAYKWQMAPIAAV